MESADNNAVGFAGIERRVQAVLKEANQPLAGPPQPEDSAAATDSGQGITRGGKILLIGVGCLVIALIIFATLTGKTSQDPSGSSVSRDGNAAASPPKNYQAPSPSYSDTPSEPPEVIPPVSTTASLTLPQIRYCKCEDVRLEAMRRTLDQYNQYEVDIYNQYVQDYNSRCSEYRYRKSDMQQAMDYASSFRLTLESQGRKRLGR